MKGSLKTAHIIKGMYEQSIENHTLKNNDVNDMLTNVAKYDRKLNSFFFMNKYPRMKIGIIKYDMPNAKTVNKTGVTFVCEPKYANMKEFHAIWRNLMIVLMWQVNGLY